MLESVRLLFPRDYALTPKFDYCVKLLQILGKIQHFARARRLNTTEVQALEHEIDNLRNLVLQVFLELA